MDELDRMYRRLVQNIRAGFPDLLTRAFEVSLIYQQIIPYRLNRRELALDSNDEYELALLRLLSGERGLISGDEEMQRALRAELESPNPDLSAFRAYATSTVSLDPEAMRALDAQPQVRGISPSSAPVPGRPAAAATVPVPAAAPPSASPVAHAAPAAPAAPAAAPIRPAARPAPAAPSPPPSEIAARATEEISVAGATTRPASAAPMRERAPGPVARSAAAPSRPTPPGCRYCGGELPAGRDVHFCPHCGQNLTIKQCPACSTELEVAWHFCVNCGRQVE